MKILAFSDIGCINTSFEIEKLIVIIKKINPDIITLIGGLFSQPHVIKSEKQDIINHKLSIDILTRNIFLLNLVQKPVFIIPNEIDLRFHKGISRLTRKDEIWIRWLHNKGTTVDGWTFLGIGSGLNLESIQTNIKHYRLFSDKIVVLMSTNQKIHIPDSNPPIIILIPSKIPITLLEGWTIQVGNLKENKLSLIDIDNKIIKLVNLKDS